MHLSALLLLLMALSAANYIQVPPAVNQGSLSLRMHQLHRTGYVFDRFGPLKRIFKKEVFKIDAGNEVAFPTCYEQMPYAAFQRLSQFYAGQDSNTYGLVYDFQKIKNRRSLLDIEMTPKKIIYAREDGNLRLVNIGGSNLKLSFEKQFKTKQDKISKGNIVILPTATYRSTVGYGLFINHNQAVLFDLQGKDFKQLEGYQQRNNFEAAVPIEDKYLAVAYGEQGVVLYSIDFEKNSLKTQTVFDQTNLDIKTINFKDLAYDHSRKLLFMLDHSSGVIPMQLLMVAERFEAQATSSVIKKNSCNLIYFDAFTQELYVSCKELLKYSIGKWPILQQKVLPKQEITIRSISSWGGSVVLAGRNVLQIIAQERKVAVYEDHSLQKFIISNGTFLSANQHKLLIGKYEIVPPEITCHSQNTSLVGNHLLLFKITAECNLDYLKSIGFEPGPLYHNDKCVYSVYQGASVWQPKEVNVKPFIIILGVIAALGLLLFVWWVISQIQLKKLKSQISQYQTLEEEQAEKSESKNDPVDSEPIPATAMGLGVTGNSDLNEQVNTQKS